MASIPLWLTGKNVTTCTVTPQAVSGAGVLSDSSPVAALYGHVDEVSVRSSIEAEEISPMDTVLRNMVPIKVGTTITISEVLKAGDLTNLLAKVAYGSTSFFKIALARGGQAWVFYGLLVDYDEALRRGRSVGTAVFDMVDPGEPNPAYGDV